MAPVYKKSFRDKWQQRPGNLTSGPTNLELSSVNTAYLLGKQLHFYQKKQFFPNHVEQHLAFDWFYHPTFLTKMVRGLEAMWSVKEETTKDQGGIVFKRLKGSGRRDQSRRPLRRQISAQYKEDFLTSVQSQMQ